MVSIAVVIGVVLIIAAGVVIYRTTKKKEKPPYVPQKPTKQEWEVVLADLVQLDDLDNGMLEKYIVDNKDQIIRLMDEVLSFRNGIEKLVDTDILDELLK